MAAELVETSRLWGRIAGRVEPEWVEPLAQHLVKRSYSEPHWEKKQAAVMAYEKVTLYGVPLVTSRKVNFGRIDPALSRELFIRHALVEGDWQTHHQFWADNKRLLDRDRGAGEPGPAPGHPGRRRDHLRLLRRSGSRPTWSSGRHFDSWWKKTRREQPDLLTFTRDAAGQRRPGRGGRGRLPGRVAGRRGDACR